MQISQISITSNTDIEFISNGRLYVLLIEQQHLDNAFGQTATYWENSYTGQGYNDIESEITLSTWNGLKISEADALEVILANQVSWDDVTECTDRGQALLAEQRKAARRNLLSHIVTCANKMRSTLKGIYRPMRVAMSNAWEYARIIMRGTVSFIKVADIDNEAAEVHTRRVSPITSGPIASSLFKFYDLDKIAANIQAGMDEITAKAKSIISMHVWQIV